MAAKNQEDVEETQESGPAYCWLGITAGHWPLAEVMWLGLVNSLPILSISRIFHSLPQCFIVFKVFRCTFVCIPIY